MRPSEFHEFIPYPSVRHFVGKHLDMQFDDVRALLRLPLPEQGINSGCNFAAAAILCNLISGISVVLYTPPSGKSGSGDRFKFLLKDFFPWRRGEDRENKSAAIYDLLRNPLVHSLGVPQNKRQDAFTILVKKQPLSEQDIQILESADKLPVGFQRAVTKQGERYIVFVPALYWSVRNLLRCLARDRLQMQRAETYVSTL